MSYSCRSYHPPPTDDYLTPRSNRSADLHEPGDFFIDDNQYMPDVDYLDPVNAQYESQPAADPDRVTATSDGCPNPTA